MSFTKLRYSIVLGNLMDHYDSYLFLLLAPVVGELFFPQFDSFSQILLVYSPSLIHWVTRPLGALYSGFVAKKIGGIDSVSTSLLGLGLITATIGILPDYSSWGYLSSILIFILRGVQGFFASAEVTVGPMLLMHITSDTEKSRWSGIFQLSTILGFLLSSMLISILSSYGVLKLYWRYLFFLGSITSFIGCYIRHISISDRVLKISNEGQELQPQNSLVVSVSIFVTSILPYITYHIPFVSMNVLVPKITQDNITYNDMMQLQNILLVFDYLLIAVCIKFIKKDWIIPMLIGALGIICISCPLLSLIDNYSSKYLVTITRCSIILFGVIFSVSLNNFIYFIAPPPRGYQLYGISRAIGVEIFGRSTPLISSFLCYYSGNMVLLSLYLVFWAIMSFSVTVNAVRYRISRAILE